MSSKKKKPSGCEYKKMRKIIKLENKLSGDRLRSFLKASGDGVKKQSTCTSDDDVATSTPSASQPGNNFNIDGSSTTNSVSPVIIQLSVEHVASNATLSRSVTSRSSDIFTSDPESENDFTQHFTADTLSMSPSNKTTSSEEKCNINFNEPRTWPPMNNKIRCTLNEHGIRSIDEIMNQEDFSLSEKGDRKFEATWFYKILSNEEKTVRDWLLYGNESKSLSILFSMHFISHCSEHSDSGFSHGCINRFF